ncbi:uncharacterized protein fam83ga [Carassius auratus]|uniref:Uncharacterized protein fam83ga n=1 Tax=Carassius auratus TaxID=7957 RepID=A0A6P6NAE9_CARAU|nr:uncharacterized protein LOC113078108 [Carassius auratus]
MALSQVQCLDDNHINLRTNESKPEFFYSEQQRLALETLIHEGRDAYEDYIKTHNIRCFLSDLEVERILSTVEVYSPGSPDDSAELLLGDSDGEHMSLQYWPDRSDRSIPLLDIGWPDRASYRGVTRAQVYTQPPHEGQSHIKEVVRKMISQAQKVIAIAMDLFTDIDIFKDLLDASYKRKVSVYIVLETTGVKHFLRMCEKAGMHTGHLKNLRVRSIRGADFFSRFSKRVCGSQSQKFMFIDGDKAVSGSYSFTWSASRLDRNLITVLTGQAVDTFDLLFQDMYMMSNGVCLSKINLSSEPEPEFLPKVVPILLPSATTALKLINPKYTLVSNCAFTTNGPTSNQTSAKNSTSKNQTEVIKQMKETPVVPPVHPGLLNLEKANMINYVPTWPDPDPPSDVIGFINIRDSSKPLQAHLMRSELFEVSQAIRFKDPFLEAKESLYLRACPGPISQTPSFPEAPAQKQTSGEAQKSFDPNQHQRSSRNETVISPSEKLERVHVLACKKVNKEELCVMEKEVYSISLQSKSTIKEKDIPRTISSLAQDDTDTKQALDNLQPPKCPAQTSEDLDMKSSSSAMPNKSHHDSFALIDTPSVKQSLDDQVINDVATRDHSDANPDTNQNGWKGTQTSNFGSSISSLSDEYYECFSPGADFRSVGDVFLPEIKKEYLHNSIQNSDREQEVPCSNSPPAQDATDLANKQNLFIPKLLKRSCSIVFSYLSAGIKTTAATSKTCKIAEKTAKPPLQGFQPEVSLGLICKAQCFQLSETTTKPPLHDSQSGESPDLMLKPSKVNANAQLLTDNAFRSSTLQDKADVTPVIPEKTKATKSIEFPKSEELQNPSTDLDSGSNHPLNLKSEEHVNEHLKLQSDEVSPAVLKRKSEDHNLQEKVPEQFEIIELLILEDSDSQETELNYSEPIGPALRNQTKMSKTEPIEPKTINCRKSKENKLVHDVYSRHRKKMCHPTALIDEKQEGEHICSNQMNKNLPEAKPKLECLVRKQPHQPTSRIPIQARGGLTKLPISKADTSNRSFGLQAPKAGMHIHPLGKPLGQNKPSITSSPSPEKLSPGGVAPVRSTQRPPRTVPAPNGSTSPSKLPQVQLIAPKIGQSDQPNVSRKRSASLTKYSCSSPGISCPAQVRKQVTKGSAPNK